MGRYGQMITARSPDLIRAAAARFDLFKCIHFNTITFVFTIYEKYILKSNSTSYQLLTP